MAFRFNWASMDDSVAEMVRLLVNDKLETMLKERLGGAAQGNALNAHCSPPLALTTAAAAAGGSGNHITRTASGAEASTSGSVGGLVQGLHRLGATDETSTSSFPFPQGGGAGTGGGPSAGMLFGASAAGGSTTVNAGLYGGGSVAVPAMGASAPSASPTALNPLGAVHAPIGTTATANASGTALFMNMPSPAAAMSGAGGGGTGITAQGNTNNNNVNSAIGNHGSGAGGTTTASKLPPIRELYVDAIEWGVAAPFIEVVNFEDAIAFADDEENDSRANRTAGSNAPTSHTYLGQSPQRQSSYHSTRPCSSPSTEQEDFTAVTAAGLVGVPSRSSSRLAGSPELPYNLSTAAGVRDDSESDTAAVRPAAAAQARTSRPPLAPPVSHGSGGGASGLQDETFASVSASTVPTVDPLTQLFGQNGLFVRLHVTYGGSMSFSVKTTVQHELAAGPIRLPVSMPLEIRAGDVDLDCFVCFNIANNECRVWLEPGKISTSPLNRLNLTVIFGTERRSGTASRHGAGGLMNDSLEEDASFFDEYGDGDVADDYDDFGSSSTEEADDESVYVDESAVSQFVLRELKAILQEKLVAPHYVRIPLR